MDVRLPARHDSRANAPAPIRSPCAGVRTDWDMWPHPAAAAHEGSLAVVLSVLPATTWPSSLVRWLAIYFLPDAVQHAIDELHRVLCAEGTSEFQGLVDHDRC